jgi:hypothetical protein
MEHFKYELVPLSGGILLTSPSGDTRYLQAGDDSADFFAEVLRLEKVHFNIPQAITYEDHLDYFIQQYF